MSKTKTVSKTAPFLSIDAFGEPDEIEEHYKKWLQYEVANGENAKSWQQTFDAALLKILKRRRNIEFKEPPEMQKDETSEQFRTRRLADAERVAKELFDLQKPTVRTEAKAALVAKCPFKANRRSSLVSQVLRHESKFLTAAEQVGAISALELCEAYIACFPEEMQNELAIVGAENKKEKKAGFLEWTEYADWVNDRAQLVHAAEAAIKLFYPKAKTISLFVPLKASGESSSRSPEPADRQEPKEDRKDKPRPKPKEKVRCYNCNLFGHYQVECPNLEDSDKAGVRRGRDETRAKPKAPRDRADSVKVQNRRSARIAEKTEKLASRAKYAASAVKQSRRKFKAKVNAFAKHLPGGTQNTVLTTKDLKELLDTDFSDPNTDSLDDSIYGSDKDTDSDEE